MPKFKTELISWVVRLNLTTIYGNDGRDGFTSRKKGALFFDGLRICESHAAALVKRFWCDRLVPQSKQQKIARYIDWATKFISRGFICSIILPGILSKYHRASLSLFVSVNRAERHSLSFGTSADEHRGSRISHVQAWPPSGCFMPMFLWASSWSQDFEVENLVPVSSSIFRTTRFTEASLLVSTVALLWSYTMAVSVSAAVSEFENTWGRNGIPFPPLFLL